MDRNAPTAGLLVIGNEVLSGRTQDANIRFLALGLGTLGIPVREVRIIPDVGSIIIDTVNEMRARYTHLFTTGGIGPTHDDITSECVAAAFGVTWEPHAEAMALMAPHFAAGEFNEARQRMATMPRGARLIRNAATIAPGFSIGNVHVMAGVPRIMRAMFATLEAVLERGAPVVSRAVHAQPMQEGRIAGGLGALQLRYPDIDLGSYPYERDGGYGVTIVAKGTDLSSVEQVIAEATSLIAACGYAPVQGDATTSPLPSG